MGKNKSPLQQSLLLFKNGDAIGQSRVPAKDDGTIAWKVFHSTTFHNYVGNFAHLLEFVRDELNVRQVKDLTPDHVSAFFRSLNDRGLADSTIQKYMATINKGDAIARHIGWRPVEAPPLVRPEPKGPRLVDKPTPYSCEEADRIINVLDGLKDQRFAAIAQLQRGLGLRVREACAISVRAVHPDGLDVSLSHNDRTKKGRPRTISAINAKTQSTLREWRSIALKSSRQRLFITSAKQVDKLVRDYQKAFASAAREEGISHSKTHDMRRTFVAERLEFYLSCCISRAEALKRLSEDLGHGRSRMERGLLASYLPSDEE